MASDQVKVLVEEKISQLHKIFECPICLDLMRNPVSTKCGHRFCRFCLLEAIGKKRTVPCPLCKEPLTKRSLQGLKQWSNIVDTVGSLVSAYQIDTGVLYSPARTAFPLSQAALSPDDIFTENNAADNQVDDFCFLDKIGLSMMSDPSPSLGDQVTNTAEDDAVVPVKKTTLKNSHTSDKLPKPNEKRASRKEKGTSYANNVQETREIRKCLFRNSRVKVKESSKGVECSNLGNKLKNDVDNANTAVSAAYNEKKNTRGKEHHKKGKPSLKPGIKLKSNVKDNSSDVVRYLMSGNLNQKQNSSEEQPADLMVKDKTEDVSSDSCKNRKYQQQQVDLEEFTSRDKQRAPIKTYAKRRTHSLSKAHNDQSFALAKNGKTAVPADTTETDMVPAVEIKNVTKVKKWLSRVPDVVSPVMSTQLSGKDGVANSEDYDSIPSEAIGHGFEMQMRYENAQEKNHSVTDTPVTDNHMSETSPEIDLDDNVDSDKQLMCAKNTDDTPKHSESDDSDNDAGFLVRNDSNSEEDSSSGESDSDTDEQLEEEKKSAEERFSELVGGTSCSNSVTSTKKGRIFKAKFAENQKSPSPTRKIVFTHGTPTSDDPYAFRISQRTPRKKKRKKKNSKDSKKTTIDVFEKPPPVGSYLKQKKLLKTVSAPDSSKHDTSGNITKKDIYSPGPSNSQQLSDLVDKISEAETFELMMSQQYRDMVTEAKDAAPVNGIDIVKSKRKKTSMLCRKKKIKNNGNTSKKEFVIIDVTADVHANLEPSDNASVEKENKNAELTTKKRIESPDLLKGASVRSEPKCISTINKEEENNKLSCKNQSGKTEMSKDIHVSDDAIISIETEKPKLTLKQQRKRNTKYNVVVDSQKRRTRSQERLSKGEVSVKQNSTEYYDEKSKLNEMSELSNVVKMTASPNTAAEYAKNKINSYQCEKNTCVHATIDNKKEVDEMICEDIVTSKCGVTEEVKCHDKSLLSLEDDDRRSNNSPRIITKTNNCKNDCVIIRKTDQLNSDTLVNEGKSCDKGTCVETQDVLMVKDDKEDRAMADNEEMVVRHNERIRKKTQDLNKRAWRSARRMERELGRKVKKLQMRDNKKTKKQLKSRALKCEIKPALSTSNEDLGKQTSDEFMTKEAVPIQHAASPEKAAHSSEGDRHTSDTEVIQISGSEYEEPDIDIQMEEVKQKLSEELFQGSLEDQHKESAELNKQSSAIIKTEGTTDKLSISMHSQNKETLNDFCKNSPGMELSMKSSLLIPNIKEAKNFDSAEEILPEKKECLEVEHSPASTIIKSNRKTFALDDKPMNPESVPAVSATMEMMSAVAEARELMEDDISVQQFMEDQINMYAKITNKKRSDSSRCKNKGISSKLSISPVDCEKITKRDSLRSSTRHHKHVDDNKTDDTHESMVSATTGASDEDVMLLRLPGVYEKVTTSPSSTLHKPSISNKKTVAQSLESANIDSTQDVTLNSNCAPHLELLAKCGKSSFKDVLSNRIQTPSQESIKEESEQSVSLLQPMKPVDGEGHETVIDFGQCVSEARKHTPSSSANCDNTPTMRISLNHSDPPMSNCTKDLFSDTGPNSFASLCKPGSYNLRHSGGGGEGAALSEGLSRIKRCRKTKSLSPSPFSQAGKSSSEKRKRSSLCGAGVVLSSSDEEEQSQPRKRRSGKKTVRGRATAKYCSPIDISGLNNVVAVERTPAVNQNNKETIDLEDAQNEETSNRLNSLVPETPEIQGYVNDLSSDETEENTDHIVAPSIVRSRYTKKLRLRPSVGMVKQELVNSIEETFLEDMSDRQNTEAKKESDLWTTPLSPIAVDEKENKRIRKTRRRSKRKGVLSKNATPLKVEDDADRVCKDSPRTPHLIAMPAEMELDEALNMDVTIVKVEGEERTHAKRKVLQDVNLSPSGQPNRIYEKDIVSAKKVSTQKGMTKECDVPEKPLSQRSNVSYEAVTTPGMPLTPLSPDEQDEFLCNYLTTPVGMDAANSNFSFKHESQADLPDRPHSSLAEPLPQSPDRHSNASDRQAEDTDYEDSFLVQRQRRGQAMVIDDDSSSVNEDVHATVVQSQCDVLNTQQKETLEENVRKIQQEIAMLEARLFKDNSILARHQKPSAPVVKVSSDEGVDVEEADKTLVEEIPPNASEEQEEDYWRYVGQKAKDASEEDSSHKPSVNSVKSSQNNVSQIETASTVTSQRKVFEAHNHDSPKCVEIVQDNANPGECSEFSEHSETDAGDMTVMESGDELFCTPQAVCQSSPVSVTSQSKHSEIPSGDDSHDETECTLVEHHNDQVDEPVDRITAELLNENVDNVLVKQEADTHLHNPVRKSLFKSVIDTSCSPCVGTMRANMASPAVSRISSDKLFASPLIAVETCPRLPSQINRNVSKSERHSPADVHHTATGDITNVVGSSCNNHSSPVNSSIISSSHQSLSGPNHPQKPDWIFVCSGINRVIHKPYIDNLLAIVGGRVISKFTPAVTHVLVRPVEEGQRICARTLKYFQGVANRKWVLSVEWAVDCIRKDILLPEVAYEITGDSTEEHEHWAPRRSRLSTASLLPGFEICCYGNFHDLTKDDLRELVEACGGTTVQRPDLFNFDPNMTQIVIVESDQVDKMPDLKKIHKYGNMPIISKDWLLSSVGCFSVQDQTDFIIYG